MAVMRKFKLWPERTVDHRGHLIIPEPVDVVAEGWQLVDGALLFLRDDRNWIAVAKGAWSMLREVTEAAKTDAGRPTYNHTRGDSALTPCLECAAHPGHVPEGGA